MRSANDVLLYGLSQRSFYHAGKFVDAATAAKVCFYTFDFFYPLYLWSDNFLFSWIFISRKCPVRKRRLLLGYIIGLWRAMMGSTRKFIQLCKHMKFVFVTYCWFDLPKIEIGLIITLGHKQYCFAYEACVFSSNKSGKSNWQCILHSLLLSIVFKGIDEGKFEWWNRRLQHSVLHEIYWR